MRKQIVAVIAVVSLALPAVSFASPASEKSIKELMSLTGAGNMGVQAMKQMLPSMKQLVPQAPESFWEDFMKEVDPNELVGLIVPIYQKYFTEEEIRETIKFYKSPTGKKVVQTLPSVMHESMMAGQVWGQKLAQRAIEKAKAKETK